MEKPASHKAMGHSTRPSARSHADNGNFSSQSRSSSKTATQKARDLEVLLPTTEITQHLQAQDSKDSHSTATGTATATSPTKSEVNDIPAEKDTKAEKVTEQETDKDGKAAEVKVKADPEKPQLKAKCLYRLEYRDQNDNLLHEKESDTAAGAEPPKRDEAVIEVITTIRVKQTETASSKEFKPQSARGKKETTELRINSLNLANAIRAVVSYYPGTYLLEEPLTFTAPYKLLVHHRKLLAEYKSQHPPSHDAEYVEETNEHIDVLLGFLSEHFGTDLDAEEERHRQNPPICTFEYAWLLFQPGVDIYTVPSDFPPNTPRSVHVVSHVSGGLVDGEFSPYKISMWNLESDGECVGRYNHGVEIPPFDGEREITSLTAYPLSILAETKRLSIEEALIERGRRYYEFTKICHKQFNGYTLTNPRRRYDTQVVLDTYLYFTIYPKEDNTELNLNFDAASGVSGCNCDRCRKFKRPAGKAKYGNYDKLKLKAARPEGERDLTPHQYMLCTQKVYGFPLKQRAWQMFDMDGISEIAFDKEIMNELVLDPPSNKMLIKALAKRYTEAPADLEIGPDTDPSIIPQNIPIKKDIWSADRVEGKGEGQIILLHGPPGVGKTLTAESVAAFVERPLLSLSVGDIGTYAQYVETNLRDWMKKARRWGAILLIDEADIYLEERSPHNFKHNSLVSVFLNNLEYYSGILFLTTNRVGVFDEAFASRIHIPIGYSPFKEATREQVWENMTKRLERERKGSVKVELSFKKYYRNDKELKKLEWNGREIRNAFQTAVSLAEFNAKEDGLEVAELKDEFLDQVVQMSLRFKEYLATFPGGDARKKAWNYGKRNDAFMASN